MNTWEYSSIQIEATGMVGGILDHDILQFELNKQGAKGWELVNVFDTNMSHGATRFVVAVFKRALDI